MANETYEEVGGRSRSVYYIPVLALVLLVVAGAGWYFYQTRVVSETVLKEQFEWAFSSSTVSATGDRLQTSVNLRIADVDVPVGTFVGNCAEIDGTNWKLLSGELSGIVCIDGEVGVEVGVFEEAGTLVLKRGEITGSDPATAERSDFEPIVNPSS
jgi:hypothetical protein